MTELKVYGVDFSSSPNKKKPIVIAEGSCNVDLILQKGEFVLHHFECMESLDEFKEFLNIDGPYVGGFDFPFSMPEKLISFYGWPTSWEEFALFYCSKPKDELKQAFKNWCDMRPKGDKFAWRETDKIAKSSPAMRWTNPPVAWMMYSGIKQMIDANMVFPAHCEKTELEDIIRQYLRYLQNSGMPYEVKLAFEVYPAYSVRKIINKSYKSDDKNKNNQMRINNRELIINMLLKGLIEENIFFRCSRLHIQQMSKDHKGDFLDASICALQACSALTKPNFGLDFNHNILEGWITPVIYNS